MADNVMLFDTTQAHAADVEFFMRRGMTKGYQLLSLLAPPAYLALSISRYGRGHVSVNRLLRATWIGGSIGILGGGGLGYLRASYSSPDNLRHQRLVAAYDTSSLRADDHSTIGMVLCSVMSPALFWKRGNAINLILGGAGIGSSIGLLAHHFRSLTGDRPPAVQIPTPPPEQPVPIDALP